jgi:hypothetical protein
VKESVLALGRTSEILDASLQVRNSFLDSRLGTLFLFEVFEKEQCDSRVGVRFVMNTGSGGKGIPNRSEIGIRVLRLNEFVCRINPEDGNRNVVP